MTYVHINDVLHLIVWRMNLMACSVTQCAENSRHEIALRSISDRQCSSVYAYTALHCSSVYPSPTLHCKKVNMSTALHCTTVY